MVGTKIDNYRIVRLIGEGGMGQVFEASEEPGGRRVAIKTLRSELTSDGEMLARFKREALALSTVKHPGLVQIYQTGTLASGGAYIVMEFLDGQSLRRLMKLRPLSPSQYLHIVSRVAETLTAVHAHNIVHRDLKPENIMLIGPATQEFQVKVLDFGIAKVSLVTATQTQLVTRAGSIFGTPIYMAPELCGGEGELCDRTDVYALGVLLYELVASKPPFMGELDQQILGKHLFQEPVPLRQVAPQASADLELLVHAMLAKNTAHRPSMETVVAAISILVSGKRLGEAQMQALRLARESPTVRYDQGSRPAPTFLGRRVSLVVAVVAFLVFLIVLLLGLFLRRPPAMLPPLKQECLIRSRPSGARIIDQATNRFLGYTPYQADCRPGQGERAFILELEHYKSQTVRLPSGPGEAVEIPLTALPPSLPAMRPVESAPPKPPARPGVVPKPPARLKNTDILPFSRKPLPPSPH